MEAALSWATLLVGTKYGWWTGGPIPAGAPAWAADGPPPPLGAIKDSSCFCAGIPNLMLRHAGLPVPCETDEYCGGTGAYGLNFSAVAQEFDMEAADSYPRGTLLGMKYHSVARQGHVVVMLGQGKTAKLLQSTANSGPGGSDPTHPGVHANVTLEDCFRTEEYCKFEYAVLPQHWIGRKLPPAPSCQDKMFGECGTGVTPGFNVTCCSGAHCAPAQKGASPVCVPGAEPWPAPAQAAPAAAGAPAIRVACVSADAFSICARTAFCFGALLTNKCSSPSGRGLHHSGLSELQRFICLPRQAAGPARRKVRDGGLCSDKLWRRRCHRPKGRGQPVLEQNAIRGVRERQQLRYCDHDAWHERREG